MRLSVLIFCIVALQTNALLAEWSDHETELAKAETAMLEYFVIGQGPDRWAAFGRGQSWGAARQGEFMRDEVYFTLLAKSAAEPSAFYYSHGTVATQVNFESRIKPGGHDSGDWEHALRIEQDRYRKKGYSLNGKYENVDETGKVSGTEREWRATYPAFDPFQLPVLEPLDATPKTRR